MMITNEQFIYTAIGAVGIYLAHSIEYKLQDSDTNWEHMNRVVLYWVVGALVYWVILNQSGWK
tara:strand:- start:267 stop:455 length:189 start_codon:yes stop_codon:yes gene_type:complete